METKAGRRPAGFGYAGLKIRLFSHRKGGILSVRRTEIERESARRAALKSLIETRNRRTERVFLVGVELKSRNGRELSDSLEELSELATTAGGQVVGDGMQKLPSPCAAGFSRVSPIAKSSTGSGKFARNEKSLSSGV